MCGVVRLREVEEQNSEYQVDREKLDAFDPICFSVAADLEEDLRHRGNGKITARIPDPEQSGNFEAITPVLDPMKLLP
jgi:hypothetical protein